MSIASGTTSALHTSPSGTRAASRSISSTRAPRSRAAMAVAWPIGPAPRITTGSAPTRPRSTACTAIDTGSVSTAGAPAAIGNACSAGTSSSSCSPPSTWMPISLKFGHTLGRPIEHG